MEVVEVVLGKILNLEVLLALGMCIALFIVSIIEVRYFIFTPKRIARIGMFSAISLVLYMIKIVPFPQGGGATLLSILPVVLLAFVCSKDEAIICALVIGVLKIVIAPPYFPLQIPLDYLGAMMVLGFAPMFGQNKKWKVFMGVIVAGGISAFFCTLSGVIFFGAFAPEGMDPWIYSLIYNYTGYGFEIVMSAIIMILIPIERFRKIAN